MYEHKTLIKVLGTAIALAFLLGLAAGVRSFSGGNIRHAQQIASRLQASAAANPNPVSGTASSVGASATAPAAGAHPAAAASSTAAAPSVTSAAPGTTAKAPATTVTQAPAKAGSSTSSASSAPAASSSATASTPSAGSTAAPRRHPTAAELSQAIAAVHSLLPFFTPTVAQLTASGNQVCSSLDQGVSFSQVKAGALNAVGAGSIAWMIPSSVPDTAVRTLVALFCPANATKLV